MCPWGICDAELETPHGRVPGLSGDGVLLWVVWPKQKLSMNQALPGTVKGPQDETDPSKVGKKPSSILLGLSFLYVSVLMCVLLWQVGEGEVPVRKASVMVYL